MKYLEIGGIYFCIICITYSEMRNKAPQLRGLGVVSNVSLIPLCLSGSVVLGGISTSLMLCGFLANG